MKRIIICAIIVTGITVLAGTQAATAPQAESLWASLIPAPKLTATQALAIAQKRIGHSTKYTLVGIDWCKASAFSPRFSDGVQYSPANDHPDEYSWFVTYLYKDEKQPDLGTMGVTHTFNALSIVRIKDDGQIGVFMGFRT